MRSSPLLWGRVMASLCRCTALLYEPEQLTIHTYVDDPLFVVQAATPEARAQLLDRAWLFWQALGVPLAWDKGAVGTEV